MDKRYISPEQKALIVKLRQKGYSYSEIKKNVPVAKSTISLLLKGIGLKKEAVKILENKGHIGQKMGAEAKHLQRLAKESEIRKSSLAEITNLTDRELFLMGIMLYWGEGAKIREGNISQQVAFGNSDPRMCKFFLNWLLNSLKLPLEDVYFSVYINEIFRDKSSEVVDFWSKYMGVSGEMFKKVSFTNTKFSETRPRKDRGNYHGLLRIRVKKSVDLNRRIEGWIEACAHS